LPTDGPDELSATLQRLRKDAGMTLAEVAGGSGLSLQTVQRLVTGIYAATPEQAEAIARAVGAPAATRRRLVAMAQDLKQRTTPRQALLRGGVRAQQQYRNIERAAGHVQSFSPVMPPGQLQTADYMREVFASELPLSQVEGAVAERLKRSAALHGGAGPRYTLLMAEGALRWQVGSPALMAAQCDHIAAVARSTSPRVRVGIIPWTQPVHIFPMHSYDLYDTRAVIFGTRTGTAYVTARPDVAAYVRLHANLVELAVFDDDAAVRAGALGDEYRALHT